MPTESGDDLSAFDASGKGDEKRNLHDFVEGDVVVAMDLVLEHRLAMVRRHDQESVFELPTIAERIANEAYEPITPPDGVLMRLQEAGSISLEMLARQENPA